MVGCSVGNVAVGVAFWSDCRLHYHEHLVGDEDEGDYEGDEELRN